MNCWLFLTGRGAGDDHHHKQQSTAQHHSILNIDDKKIPSCNNKNEDIARQQHEDTAAITDYAEKHRHSISWSGRSFISPIFY